MEWPLSGLPGGQAEQSGQDVLVVLAEQRGDRSARAGRHHRNQACQHRFVPGFQMSIAMPLDMAASAYDGRTALGREADGMSYESLRRTVVGGAGVIRASAAGSVAFIGLNGPAFPSLLIASAVAGVPFSPLNYRLSADSLAELLARLDRPLVVVDEAFEHAVGTCDRVMTADAWLSPLARRRRCRRPTWPTRTARCCCSPAARLAARRVSCSATRTWSAT